MEPKITLRLLTRPAALREIALDALASARGRLQTIRLRHNQYDVSTHAVFDRAILPANAWFRGADRDKDGSPERYLAPALDEGRYALTCGDVRGTLTVSLPNPNDDDDDTFTLTLRTADPAARDAILGAIAAEFTTNSDDDTFSVYRGTNRGWTHYADGRSRSRDTVLLPAAASSVFEDLRRFLADRERYARWNITFRRGYLFQGPPGNGKTTLASALATAFDYSMATLNVAGLTSNELTYLLSNLPAKSILLLEDIDYFFVDGKAREMKGDAAAFADLLNALDGVGTADGLIVIMTTNHPERLDPALVRPGRVDRVVTIENADDEQARQIFLRFLGEEHDGLAREFAGRAGDGRFSMAALQEHLLLHRDDPEAAATAEIESGLSRYTPAEPVTVGVVDEDDD